MSNNPAAIISPNGTNMNVFYGDTTGKLADEYWINTSGWNRTTLP